MINLVQAIERGDISLFKQLIANGFDLNAWCDTQMLTLLHHAVFYEQKELVEYFLQQGINVNAMKTVKLHFCICWQTASYR